MTDPRREHAQASKLTPVLVAYAIVGVVVASAIGRKPALGDALQELTCQGAIRAAFLPGSGVQHSVDLLRVERTFVLLGVGVGCSRRDPKLFLAEGEDRVGRHVVASRPKDAIDDHTRRGLKLGVLLGVELHDEAPLRGVLDDETRISATNFAADDHERRTRRPADGRASRRLGRRDCAHANSVLEPGGIRDLVERVRVTGSLLVAQLEQAVNALDHEDFGEVLLFFVLALARLGD